MINVIKWKSRLNQHDPVGILYETNHHFQYYRTVTRQPWIFIKIHCDIEIWIGIRLCIVVLHSMIVIQITQLFMIYCTGELHLRQNAILECSVQMFDIIPRTSFRKWTWWSWLHLLFQWEQDFVTKSNRQGYILFALIHDIDVIMVTLASQITSLTIVYSIGYSSADQRKHQSSASLAFVWGIHRWPVNSPHKGPVTQKMFPFDDVIMIT